MIIGSLEWWKMILWKKYFRGSRLRCVENPIKSLSYLEAFESCITNYQIKSYMGPRKWKKGENLEGQCLWDE